MHTRQNISLTVMEESDLPISPRAHYDRIAATYDTLYRDLTSQYEDARVRAMLQQWDIASSSVLDLGCGTGLFLDWGFVPKEYLGVDIAPNMISVAQRKHPSARFLCDDMRCVEGVFDIVFSLFGACSYVLDGNLSCLLCNLKSGGRFLLMPYAVPQEGLRLRPDRSHPTENALLVRPYTAAGARRALGGVQDVRVRGLNACLPLGPSLSRPLLLRNALLERLAPDLCAHLIVTGRKPR